MVYEKWVTETNFIEKECGSDFSIFWPHFYICIDSAVTKFRLFKNE